MPDSDWLEKKKMYVWIGNGILEANSLISLSDNKHLGGHGGRQSGMYRNLGRR